MKQSRVLITVAATTILTLLACSSSIRQKENVYAGDQLKDQWTEVKDSTRAYVRDGKYVSYYESGGEQTAGEYRNGLKTGLWTTKSENGYLLEWQDYVEGELHGLSVSYYANRNKKHEGRLSHDKRHGAWRTWYESGNPKSEAVYKNDRQYGIAIGWHENGQKKEESLYTDGVRNGAYVAWRANGLRKMEGRFRNGRRDGLWITWDDMGLVLVTEQYAAGELQLDTTTTGSAQVSDEL